MSALNLSEQQQIVSAADKWRGAAHDEHIGGLFAAVERIAAARSAEIGALASEAIAAVGGSHSHWREGGVGGRCRTCEIANQRQDELRERLDALANAPKESA